MTTDPTGDSCTVDRSARILVGVCIGAQMAGVDAAAAALAGQDSMSENG
ncbi:MAG TPA: hypothetical protein VFV18_07555 [Porticoccaceae bacterium]|nr:hypothetical protein [Porticoccaceae bacterium]